MKIIISLFPPFAKKILTSYISENIKKRALDDICHIMNQNKYYNLTTNPKDGSWSFYDTDELMYAFYWEKSCLGA